MRRLLATALLALPLFACSAQTTTDAASSESAIEESKPRLLAIGDSITFGWDPQVEADIHKVQAAKYHSYADVLGQRLGLAVDNAACPGETSGSLLDPKAEDNGCRDNRAAYALHTSWGDAADQIEFITTYLEKAVAAGKPPELITMTIGGNDLLLVQHHCALPSLLKPACEVVKIPFAVHAYGGHLTTILQAIAATGYKGKVVLLKTYAPDYSDHVATLGLGLMNSELEEHVKDLAGQLALDVRVADTYGAFEARAKEHGGKTCETGLLIPKGDGTCDIHPTPAGHEVLADAVQEAMR